MSSQNLPLPIPFLDCPKHQKCTKKSQILYGRAHTESTRHESTRMSHETHLLNLRGNMDTPMRGRFLAAGGQAAFAMSHERFGR